MAGDLGHRLPHLGQRPLAHGAGYRRPATLTVPVPHHESSVIDLAIGLLAVLLLTLGTAVFVAGEFAFVAVDRTLVEAEARAGGRRARLTAGVLGRLSFHLSGAQLGITITSLIVGFVAEPLLAGGLEPLLGGFAGHGVTLALALVIATVIQMVLGELVPKNLAIARPVATAFVMAPVFRIYGLVFGFMITFLNEAANWTVRRLGIEPKEELASVRTIEELELLIRSSGEQGTLPASSTLLLTRSIRFTGKTAADALVPRTALVALTTEDTAADLVEAADRTGYSRFPVVGADVDDVTGVVHVKDVYRVPHEERATTPLGQLMHEVLAVPESRSLDSLLVEMRGTGAHLVVVIDEYGGTAGIITLEDVLEEIVGEIDDEHDPRAAEVQVTATRGTWELPGSLHLDEVLDACGLDLPEGEYETVAGFVLDRLQHIPGPGEVLEHDGWRIEVVEMDRLRVASLRVTAPRDRDRDRDRDRGVAGA